MCQGYRIGYYQGEQKLLLEDIQALQPTFFPYVRCSFAHPFFADCVWVVSCGCENSGGTLCCNYHLYFDILNHSLFA